MAKKPVGWKKEPARHALAAKGIKTGTSEREARDARYWDLKSKLNAMNEREAMANGPTDEEANAWAWEHYKEHWNGLGSQQMDEFYAEWERDHAKPEPASGGVRYCGYVIGRGEGQITPEEVERLFHFIHANYTPTDLIQMGDKQLHEIAEDNEDEWRDTTGGSRPLAGNLD